MVRRASCHPTFLSDTRTLPCTSFATTMLRPLNSATARTTVRISAPSTLMLKVPEPVRTSPTCLMALGSCAWAATGAKVTRAAPAISSRLARSLAVRIRISLPRQWDGHRLRLAVRGDAHDQRIALQALHHTVHDLVAGTQHRAVPATVL